MQVEVLDDPEATARRAVDAIVEASARAIAERGQFVWAVSGGSTPRRMLELLAERNDIDWGRMHLFQVDERLAPDGDADRNATMLDETILANPAVAERIGRLALMPVTAEDPVAAAAEYAALIDEVTGSPAVFDLVQLGMGSDGHTASLIPGDDVLGVDDVDVALTGLYNGRRRMTLTWPVLDRAKELLWVITGESKQGALQQFFDNDPSIPATLPTQARALVLTDSAANA